MSRLPDAHGIRILCHSQNFNYVFTDGGLS
jgi:hypothetical protein